MITFYFYFIFELKFHHKKELKTLVTAVSVSVRTVLIFCVSLGKFGINWYWNKIGKKKVLLLIIFIRMYAKEEILKIPGNDLKTKLKIVMNKLVSVPCGPIQSKIQWIKYSHSLNLIQWITEFNSLNSWIYSVVLGT